MPAEMPPPGCQNEDAPPLNHGTPRSHHAEAGDGSVPQPQSPPPHSPPQQLRGGVVGEDFSASEAEDSSEYIQVDLQKIHKEVQCPICLGIIKNTRTVKECLHRFCRECIDKSMRLGNNECPTCRTHCASRRSLTDDPRFDAIIAALFPDIELFEEELGLHEEEKTHNIQVQASIAQISKRQSDAAGKKRLAGNDRAGSSGAGSRSNYRCTNPRRRRRRRRRSSITELRDSEDSNNDNEEKKLSSPAEHTTEIRKRKRGRRLDAGSSYPPSPAAYSLGECIDFNPQQNCEGQFLSPGIARKKQMPTWGRGGIRSSSRHGSANGGISKGARSCRLAKLVDFLQKLEENDEEYVAPQNPMEAEKVELYVVKRPHGSYDGQWLHPPSCICDENHFSEAADPSCQGREKMLEELRRQG